MLRITTFSFYKNIGTQSRVVKFTVYFFRDLFNSDIFENDIDQNDESSKRKSWNLENSFENSESNPSKRKRIAHKPSTTSLMQSEPIDLAPYPDLKKGNVRGCLRNDSNNPGLSVQNLLKGKQPVKQSSLNVQERGSFETERTSNSFGFKLHPFLAKVIIICSYMLRFCYFSIQFSHNNNNLYHHVNTYFVPIIWR